MDLCLIAQSFSWLSLSSWWAIVQMVLGIGFVIFVHELGHFLVAKACGVKCEKFYVGFDAFSIKIAGRVLVPSALWKMKWGETEYGIGIIPLGGYVKMLGQDDNPANFQTEQQRALAAGTAAEPSARESSPENSTVPRLDRAPYDPRSYLAKSVPQRMAIISAGVIFNLFFAVIFATVAFQLGVRYTPPIIGSTLVGSPAWEAELDGATVLRMGSKRLDKGYQTFMDIAQEAALHGAATPIEIEYRLPNDDPAGPARTTWVQPKVGLVPQAPFAMIGAMAHSSTQLDATTPVRPWFSASRAIPPLQGKDRIVRVEGQSVGDLTELMRELAPRFDRPVTIVVERKEGKRTQQIEVVVPPTPMRDVGFYCQWEGVAAIQRTSPASAAGFKVGDRLKTLDGEPIGDLITLDQRLLRRMREGKTEFVIGVDRAQGEGEEPKRVELTVVPRVPTINPQYSETMIPLVTLGLAVESSRQVAFVNPDSQVGQNGLRVGDRLLLLEAKHSPQQAKNKDYALRATKWNLEKDDLRYSIIREMLQSAAPDLTFALTVAGPDGVQRRIDFQPVESSEFFIPQRGFVVTPYERSIQSSGWRESFTLGLWQTGQETTRIVKILRQVVTGQLSLTNFGGPGTIAVVATSEASAGTARLLLFLTLLSANLAVINFLPIPVLDGGHMVFLTYEGIFRRPVTPIVQNVLLYLGLAFILGLMAFVIFLDISRIPTWLY